MTRGIYGVRKRLGILPYN
ncbi:hypothetical protein ECTW09195_5993, partial [Escherichia coli TW09195]